jgi:peptidyl-prolyl cis-trans isomerase D
MALIGKIRERAGIAVSIIAGSLLLFIVGGEVMQIMDKSPDQYVGNIAGQKVKYEEYAALVEKTKQENEMAQGKPMEEYQVQQLREEIWNQFIFDNAYKKQLDLLGITLTTEEEVDMVQGQNPHAFVVQNFGNPQTGKVDVAQVRNFLQAIQANQVPPAQKAMWFNFEKLIKRDRLKVKYENLLAKTVYITTAEAKRDYITQNTKADFKYLFASYNAIADSTVKFTNDDIKSYLEKNKEKYKVQNDNATLQYLTFPIIASSKDSSFFREELAKIKVEFAAATDDSSFVSSTSDVPNLPNYVFIDEIPLAIKMNGSRMDSVVGPVNEGTSLKFYKLANTKQDTISYAKASHILISPKDKTSDTSKANARVKAEGILRELQSGKVFEDVARQSSVDYQSGQKGGDLGWFPKKAMVKPFSDAVFAAASKGLIARLVESEFGFHIIKVTEAPTTTKYLIATVEKQLEASSETRELIYNKANDFISKVTNNASFIASAKTNNYIVLRAEGIAKASQSINGLSEVRDIVRWIYGDIERGAVAKEVFECKNNYVVAFLEKKRMKGYLTVDEDITKIATDSLEPSFREVVYQVRKEIKGKELLKKVSASTGTLEQIVAKLGTGAIVNSTPGLPLGSFAFAEAGYDPAAIGYAFGLAKNGDKTKAFAGENGVLIIELTNKINAPETKDYSLNKTNLLNSSNYGTADKLKRVIEETSDIVDDRYRFF